MAPLARFEAGVGEHPAQVDDQLSVDVLAVSRLEDLGLAADLDLAVGFLGCRSDGLLQARAVAMAARDRASPEALRAAAAAT